MPIDITAAMKNCNTSTVMEISPGNIVKLASEQSKLQNNAYESLHRVEKLALELHMNADAQEMPRKKNSTL